MPSTHLTGYLYSELGYTTVMQASQAAIAARHVHEELEDVPNIDKGALTVMGNNHFIMQAIADGRYEKAKDYVAWLLGASRGYGIKVVNPGGVENWKWGKNVAELDDEVIGYGVTPRQIVQTLAQISDDLGLPHSVHIHGINLGRHTSARTTVEMIDALAGHRAHLCHLQFLSYTAGRTHVHRSAAEAVAEAVNANPNITIDVGQLVFGDATTMTCDGPLQYALYQTTGHRWVNTDVESETGGGIVPITYKASNPINATMWLTGMELFLLVDDPWRVFLSTDHPNAGPFTSYPQIIRLLMDREYRREMFESIQPAGAQGSRCSRSWTASTRSTDIAIISRAGPARALGLERKGHLGVGADGDIAVYRGSRRQGGHVRPASVRLQGWRARGPRRRRRSGRERARLLRGTRLRRPVSKTNSATTSRPPTRCRSTTTPSLQATTSAPRSSPAAEEPRMPEDPECRIVRDTQREPPAVSVALSRAGVTNLRRIITIEDGSKAELFYATLDLFADLSPDHAGVHMSRFSEVVEDLAEGLTRKPFADIESLAKRMAEEVVRDPGGAARRGAHHRRSRR